MNKKQEKLLVFLLLIFLCLMMGVYIGILLSYLKDGGKYNYCIEWDGWIHRDNMIYNCYDFEKQEQKCYWYVISVDQILMIYNIDGSVRESYNCSRFVKTITINQKKHLNKKGEKG